MAGMTRYGGSGGGQGGRNDEGGVLAGTLVYQPGLRSGGIWWVRTGVQDCGGPNQARVLLMTVGHLATVPGLSQNNYAQFGSCALGPGLFCAISPAWLFVCCCRLLAARVSADVSHGHAR